MRPRASVAVATIAVALTAAAADSAFSVAVPPGATPPNRLSVFLTPTIISPTCHKDASRRAGCQLVRTFFRSVNSRRFAIACSLLGNQLRTRTGGANCTGFLTAAIPEPQRWGIVRARITRSGVAVTVSLDQSELDHVVTRRWIADLGREGGRLKILETRLGG